MIFKDLKILKEKENRIFLVFVIWMLFSLILNYIIPFITLIIALPLLSYSCMLFIYTASKEKDIINMNFREYIIVFSMSIILGFLPLIVYFFNVFIYLTTVLIMFSVSLIMYIFIPRFHKKETYIYSLSSLIIFGLIAASFTFFLLFFPSYIMYKCYKGTHKLENKFSKSTYSKIWYLIQLVCGIVLGFVIIAASKVTHLILGNNYGNVEFDIAGPLDGVIGIMLLVIFITIVLLFFRVLNAWMGFFMIIVGIYAFYLMLKAYYTLSISMGISGGLTSSLSSYQNLIDIGVFIIDIILFFYVIAGFMGKISGILDVKIKSLKFESILLWLIISELSYNFINAVSSDEMTGIKNIVGLSLFILVGLVGIYGLILHTKQYHAGKTFQSRKLIVIFLILAFFGFFVFLEIIGIITLIFPVLSSEAMPVLSPGIILFFGIFGLIGIVYFLINVKNDKLKN